MGKEKSPRWDGLIVEFFLAFQTQMQYVVTLIANEMFKGGEAQEETKKGLIK